MRKILLLLLLTASAFGQGFVSAVAVVPNGTKATVQWITCTPADSFVRFGVSSSYGRTSGVVTAKVVSHSYILSGLVVGQTYHYQIRSIDSINTQAQTADAVFVAQNPSPTLQSLTVQPSTAIVLVGQQSLFTAAGTYSDGTVKDVSSQAVWGTSNSAIATMNGSTATGLSAGAVNVNASVGNTAATAAVLTVNTVPVSYKVLLNWQASTTTGVKYNVYRTQTAGVYGATPVATGTTVLTFTDTSVKLGEKWYYVIKSTIVDSTGATKVSAPSNETSAQIPTS